MAPQAQSLGDFYRAFYPRLYRYVFVQTGGAHGEVEDIVQETLLHAWLRREEVLRDAQPETWIAGIARHKIADAWRGRKRREARDAAVREALDRIDAAPIPEDLLDTIELRQAVADALAGIEGAYALVLTLRYLEGLSVRDIAARLGESESAVESRLTRAREAFRRRIGERHD